MTDFARLICLPLTFALGLGLSLGLGACTTGEEESADAEETSSSSGDGDGDGDAGSSDSNAESTEAGTTDNPDCPTGSFDCPCGIGGACDDGLECTMEGVCALGGSESTGMGTTTAATTTGLEPELYDPEECEAPSKILEVEQVEGEFCSAPCVLDEDCPESNSNADPACTISTVGGEPNHCVLLCYPAPDADDPCPEGSSCKPIPQQPNLGICTF